MSFLLSCPNCGPRPVDEYSYGGEVTARATSSEDERALFSYLYFRRNVAGDHRGRCRPAHGGLLACAGGFDKVDRWTSTAPLPARTTS